MEIWDEFTKSFEDRTYTGDDRWWLYYMTCKECGTVWLVGQDETIHDNFCLYRFSKEDLLNFKSEGIWPKYFDSYESLLALALDKKQICSFDYYNHPDESIQDTISNVLKNNPNIKNQKLGELLNLDSETLNLYIK